MAQKTIRKVVRKPKGDSLQALHTLRADLDAVLVERGREVDGLLLALLAREHVFLLGPPGVAKSMAVELLASAIDGAACFNILMTRFTLPEEMFGPMAISGLKHDRFERVTKGFLPEANFAFVDECWKASSSILNALLRLFNERAYDNGSAGRMACPIETVVGASNEMPESKELDALYDRFLLRFVTDRIHDRGAMKQMLGGDATPTVTARLTLDELHELQEAVELVTLPDAVLDLVLDVKEELAKAGFTSSDRRWKKALKLLKASALLRGRDECTDDDLLVLADVLWTDPKDRHELRQLVTKAANPALHAAQALLDAAREVYQTLPLNQGSVSEAEMGSVFTKVAEANGQFKRTIEKLNKLVAGRTSEAISEAIAQVREMSQESTRFAARLSGIDVA